MKMLKLFLVVFILFTSNLVYAAEGCLVTNRMYTSKATITIFSDPVFTTTFYTDANGKCWSPVSSGSCQVCNGIVSVGALNILICLPDLFAGKNGAVYNGSYYASFAVVDCNLDDYSWALGLGAGVFGFILIKRRQKL